MKDSQRKSPSDNYFNGPFQITKKNFITNSNEVSEIKELEDFKLHNKIVFVLKLPIVAPEAYLRYHLYPIPIFICKTDLYHISQKAISQETIIICSVLTPYPIYNNLICGCYSKNLRTQTSVNSERIRSNKKISPNQLLIMSMS